MRKEISSRENKIAILDTGGQYAHLIARRIREIGVISQIFPAETKKKHLKGFSGIIISGGPYSVYQQGSPKIDPNIFDLNIPILGICYGHQLMAHLLGGKVKRGKIKEYGIALLNLKVSNSIFKGLKKQQQVWMSHSDIVSEIPKGFQVLGVTDNCEYAAIGNLEKKFFGLQFHPEVKHTLSGQKILRNFVVNICQCRPCSNFYQTEIVQKIIEEIKAQAKNKKVLFFISGGVDSTVALTLCIKALGKGNVFGLCIDTGFLRKNEITQLKEAFSKLKFDNIKFIDKSNDFLEALKNVYDPEEKRKLIGEKFIEVQKEALQEIFRENSNWILGQGTIYPDTIESGGTKHASLIKTHHNQVEAVKKFLKENKLIEPLREFYKDEVRKIGTILNLPEEIVFKKPFPGPGLAIRCLASKETFFLKKNKNIEKIAKKYNLTSWILPLRSVGVKGDTRSYQEVTILVKEKNPLEINFDVLEKISTEIVNKIEEVNRVIYLLGSKTSISDFSKAHIISVNLNKERLDLLREADAITINIVKKSPVFKNIWQFPVILIPLSLEKGESIVLRPVCSEDAMTARFAKLPKSLLSKIINQLLSLEKIDAVFYDITNKPPATIEWE